MCDEHAERDDDEQAETMTDTARRTGEGTPIPADLAGRIAEARASRAARKVEDFLCWLGDTLGDAVLGDDGAGTDMSMSANVVDDGHGRPS